jgi:hypothetical protein
MLPAASLCLGRIRPLDHAVASMLLLPAELVLVAFSFSQMRREYVKFHINAEAATFAFLLLEPSTVHHDVQKLHARPAA